MLSVMFVKQWKQEATNVWFLCKSFHIKTLKTGKNIQMFQLHRIPNSKEEGYLGKVVGSQPISLLNLELCLLLL